jgi:hypothetical protein
MFQSPSRFSSEEEWKEEFVDPVLFSPLRLKAESHFVANWARGNDSTFRDKGKGILSDDDER